MDQVYTPKKEYKVLVRCFTYNQSKYIEDALNGFAMQQTDFPFVCLVMDDCSTDGEQEVIKTFLNRECYMEDAEYYEDDTTRVIYVQHKTNTNCFIAVYLLKENLYNQKVRKMAYVSPWREHCEYEAMCEGDDYWIHPEKLQMQVAFLDSHSDYGMVHTDFNLTKGNRNHHTIIYPDGKAFPDVLTKGIHVGTATAMYRLEIYNKIPKLYTEKGWPMGDYPLWVEIARMSKIHYLPEITSKYRITAESASHSQDIDKMLNFINAKVEIKQFYAKEYGVQLVNNGHDSAYYERIVRIACRLRNIDIAKKYYYEACEKKMLTWRTILFFYGARYEMLKHLLDLYIKV